MDLGDLIQTSVNELLLSGKIEEAIKKQIEKVVLDVVVNAMGRYTDFGKKIEHSVGRALQVHGEIDLPSYNDAILKIITLQVESQTNNLIQRQVAERMKDLLQPAPASIKLSELVAKYIEHIREQKQAGCVCYGEQGRITFRMKTDTSGFTQIELDDEPGKKQYQCDIRFGVYRSKIYTLTFDSKDVEKQLFAGPFYGFERMLFQMKAAQTEIVLDVSEGDVSTTFDVSES